ncbi:ABC transporter [Streptomyces olivaceoviridis]|uniref:ABC transporter n=1 Tax=Streptomyces olivaceoviridis TaxID=1921 RepID=UPI001F28EC5F
MRGVIPARVVPALVVPALVVPVWRTLPWRTRGAAGTVGLLVVGLPRLSGAHPDPGTALALLRSAALAFALGLAFLLDDAARQTTTPVPTGRAARTALRVALVAPVAAPWWTAVLLLAPGAHRPPAGPSSWRPGRLRPRPDGGHGRRTPHGRPAARPAGRHGPPHHRPARTPGRERPLGPVPGPPGPQVGDGPRALGVAAGGGGDGGVPGPRRTAGRFRPTADRRT